MCIASVVCACVQLMNAICTVVAVATTTGTCGVMLDVMLCEQVRLWVGVVMAGPHAPIASLRELPQWL